MPKKVTGRNGGTLNAQQKGDKALPGSGRPKSIWNTLMEEIDGDHRFERVTVGMAKEAFEKLLCVDEQTLKKIEENEDVPASIRIKARQLLNKKKASKEVEVLLNRVHGKATQKIEAKAEVVDAASILDKLTGKQGI